MTIFGLEIKFSEMDSFLDRGVGTFFTRNFIARIIKTDVHPPRKIVPLQKDDLDKHFKPTHF